MPTPRLHYSLVPTGTPVGTVLLAASERGLAILSFRPQERGARTQAGAWRHAEWIESAAHVEPYARELREYLAGKRRDFAVPVDVRGTEFQARCWRALQEIPYGQTRSYAQIARSIGHPAAFRAVGQANHFNPVAIVVPCHRVLAAQQKLGGYGGGLPMKEWLLRLEGAAFTVPQPRRFAAAV